MNRLVGGLVLLALAALEVGAIVLLAPGGIIPYWVLVLPATTAIAGFLLMFSHAIESHFAAYVERVARDLEHDAETLEESSTTWVRAMVVFTALAVGAELVLLVAYHKWDAAWGSTSVLFISVFVIICAVILGTRNKWYKNRKYTTPKWVFLIPLAGFALCAWLGTYYTEPVTPAQGAQYDYSQTRASGSGWHGTYFFTNSSSDNSGVSVPKCSGKGCGYVYLLLFLILIVVVCIVGSATIPHFWVLATLLMLTFMVIIVLHEYLVLREPERIEPARPETNPSNGALSQSSTIVQRLGASFAGRQLLEFFQNLIDILKDPAVIRLAPIALVIALCYFAFYLEGQGNIQNMNRNGTEIANTYSTQTAGAPGAPATLKASEAWKLILSDTFDDNKNGWTTGEGKSVTDGKYGWDFSSNNTPEEGTYRGLPEMAEQGDFAASIDARVASLSADCGAGLTFRNSLGPGQITDYAFTIIGSQHWRFELNHDRSNLFSGTDGTFDAIVPGALNRITVIAQGSHFTFFVNGKYAGNASDGTLKEGKVGAAVLIFGPGTCQVEFDNFEVRAP